MLTSAEISRVRAIRANHKNATDEDRQFVIDLMAREMKSGEIESTQKTLRVMRKAKLAGFVPRSK